MIYHEAAKSGYGTGRSRAYSQAWAQPFGLLTGSDDQLILRLNGAPDRAAFHHDVLEEPHRLLMPEGIGRDLRTVRKSVSVSGSLTVDLWGEELVSGLIRLGLPLVFLPHTATETLAIPNTVAMKLLPDLWATPPAPRLGFRCNCHRPIGSRPTRTTSAGGSTCCRETAPTSSRSSCSFASSAAPAIGSPATPAATARRPVSALVPYSGDCMPGRSVVSPWASRRSPGTASASIPVVRGRRLSAS